MSDPIDKAIAMADAPPPLSMVEIPIQIGTTGRPAILAVPDDITDLEVMELTAWMLRSLRAHIAGQRPQSRLVVARGTLPT